MQASGMSEKAYFYPREGSTVFLSPDNVPTRLWPCGATGRCGRLSWRRRPGWVYQTWPTVDGMVRNGKADASWLCRNWLSMLAITGPSAWGNRAGDRGGLSSPPIRDFPWAAGDRIPRKVLDPDVKLPIGSSVSYSYAQFLSRPHNRGVRRSYQASGRACRRRSSGHP